MYNTSRRSSVLTALAWLVPYETAAVSMQVLCTAYNHVPCHFMQSHINRTSAGVSLGRAALRGLVTLCRTAVCRDVTLHAHSNTKVTNVGWLAECCFTSTETVGLLGTGPRTSTSTFTQLLRSVTKVRVKHKSFSRKHKSESLSLLTQGS